MMRFTLVPLLAASVLAAPLAAQDSVSTLGVFANLQGTWEGSAWIVMGPDGRHTVRQRETVASAAAGTVITVRGVGVETLDDGTERTVHDAFAIVHMDHDGHTPVMRAFTAYNWMDMKLTLRDSGFEWRMDDPRAGKIRYAMHLDPEGRWVEQGFASRDGGTTWSQFFEMTLSRVK
ncbi:MAG: hypothetical protein ABI542_10770 [Gemmatimonadota bacterium]